MSAQRSRIDGGEEARSRLDALMREVDALEGDVRAAAERLRAGLARVRDALDTVAAQAPSNAHEPGADVDGARISALDLVLRGTPRAEAATVLAEQFPGVDAARLLEEVAETSAG